MGEDGVKPIKGKIQVHSLEGVPLPAELVSIPSGWLEVGYLDEAFEFSAKTQPVAVDDLALKLYTDQIQSYAHDVAEEAGVPEILLAFDGSKADVPPVHFAEKLGLKVEKGSEFEGCDEVPPKSASLSMGAVKLGEIKYDESAYHSMVEAVKKAQKAMAEFSVKINASIEAVKPVIASAVSSTSNAGRAAALRRRIPGVDESVKAPCDCIGPGDKHQLWTLIQHLNDHHNPKHEPTDPWSRERIADWLETLDVDLRVKDEEEVAPAPWELAADAAGLKVANQPNMGIDGTLKIGDTVTDNASGSVGKIVQAKKTYSLDYDKSVIEIKVAYPEGTLTQHPSHVTKVDPSPQYVGKGYHKGDFVELAGGVFGHVMGAGYHAGTGSYVFHVKLQNGEMADAIPEAMKKAVEPPKATGPTWCFSVGDVVEHANLGWRGKVVAVRPMPDGTESYRVDWGEQEMTSWELHSDLKQVMTAAKPSGCCDHSGADEHGCWDCYNTGHVHAADMACPTPEPPVSSVIAKLAVPSAPIKTSAEVAAWLGISPPPPLGLNDVVELAATAKTGRVTQCQVDTNNEPATRTYTVTWPDGTTSQHPREELNLVEAYSPPSTEIIDWGSKTITITTTTNW